MSPRWTVAGLVTILEWFYNLILSAVTPDHPGDRYNVLVSGQLAEKLTEIQGVVDTVGEWINGPAYTG